MDLVAFCNRFQLFRDPAVSEMMTAGRLGAPSAAFVTPPSVTTLRLVRPPQGDDEQWLLDGLRERLRANGHELCTGEAVGLPDCLFVRPHPPHILQPNGAAFVPPQEIVDDDESGCAVTASSALLDVRTNALCSDGTKDGRPVGIVVDAGCGEAVQRGSHVFAPGIIASTACYRKGDAAWLYAVIPAAGSTKLPVLQGSYVTHEQLAHHCVAILAGRECRATIAMDREEVTKGMKGIAVTVERGGFGHPALGDLPAALRSLVFLQNHCSMVPATLLDPQPHHAVLDMCAAPGGKASHLISIARRNATATAAAGTGTVVDSAALLKHAGFSLTCCDRSAARCKQMRELLVLHHSPEFVDAVVQCVPRDANKLLKNVREGDGPPQFDRILLDPPCTGFGLRPRFRPHEHTAAEVEDSADYQRKLLKTAGAMLKPGGLVSYSTCTLSPAENERTVRWALETLGAELELVRAAPRSREAALAALALKVHDDIDPTGDATAGVEGLLPICWTFGPKPPVPPAAAPAGAQQHAFPLHLPLDSPGFFVALFRKKGGSALALQT
jgi:16S rRNA C967 or C1407 C5-methylase (RsmB/RsmF family)